MQKLISIVSMIALLAGAFFLDGMYRQAQAFAFRTFDFLAISSLLWLKLGCLLIFAAANLALTWAILMRTDRSILVSSVYTLVGLIVAASTTIPGSTYIRTTLKVEPLNSFVERSTVSTMALAANTGAFITMIGLVGLVLRAAPVILPATTAAKRPAHHGAAG